MARKHNKSKQAPMVETLEDRQMFSTYGTIGLSLTSITPSVVVDYHRNGVAEQFGAGQFNWTRSTTNPGTYAPGVNSLQTFCIDPDTDVTQPVVNYTVSDLTGTGPLTAAKANAIEELWGRFHATALSDGTHAAAFQMAMWELVCDNDKNLSTGTFSVDTTTATDVAVKNLAQSELNALTGTGPRAMLLSLTSPNNQDQVFEVKPCCLTSYLGCASAYGVLAISDFSYNGPGTINGDVAIGASMNFASPAKINGTVYMNTGVVKQGNIVATGGYKTADLSGAINDAQAAANTFNAMTATQTFTGLGNNSTIIGNGGLNVIKIGSSGISLSNGVLTVHGGANDKFIIDDAGAFKFSNSGIVLTGGVSADDIIWNVGGNVTLTGGGTANFFGTILAPFSTVSVHDKTLYGDLIGLHVTDTSGFTINHLPPCTCPPQPVTCTPVTWSTTPCQDSSVLH